MTYSGWIAILVAFFVSGWMAFDADGILTSTLRRRSFLDLAHGITFLGPT